jgi:nucleotide-binding universal stress UspA family protein
VISGDVAPTLGSLTAGGRYDLVVMATHGRSPLSRFWLGSVADEMLRHATLPLLLVRPGDEEPKLTEEPDLGRIVLPLDGTELAERIVEPAATIASLMPGSELVLVRAIRPVTLFDASPAMAESGVEAAHLVMEAEAMQAKSQHDAETYLAGVAHRLEARGLKVTTHVVVEDKPAEAILHEAEGERAKLIAMETHGRSGLARLFLGSVADKVLHSAHVPILVQRPVNA